VSRSECQETVYTVHYMCKVNYDSETKGPNITASLQTLLQCGGG